MFIAPVATTPIIQTIDHKTNANNVSQAAPSNPANFSGARASDLDSMSEREFSKYMTEYAHKLGVEADATKYQRAYADILKAGLNPRLAIESLQGQGVSASSSYQYSQGQNRNYSQSFTQSNSTSAIASSGISAIARIIAAIIAAG